MMILDGMGKKKGNKMTKETTVAQNDQILQLVSFRIGNEEFGVEIIKVKEIIRMVEITRVPRAPDFIEGVINLRGKVIPVIDFRKRLELEPREWDNKTRIIVVEVNHHVIGFIVDAVTEVMRIPLSTTDLPSSLNTEVSRKFIRSIGILDKRLLILLDLEKLLDLKEKEVLEQIA